MAYRGERTEAKNHRLRNAEAHAQRAREARGSSHIPAREVAHKFNSPTEPAKGFGVYPGRPSPQRRKGY